MLTIQEITNAKPTDQQRKLFDRDGLYLVVTPANGKLWRGKYRVNDKEKTLSLGPYPKVGLAEARERWADARKLNDPSAAKRAEKKQRAGASTMPTFLEVANEWHRLQSPGWTKKHTLQVWRPLDIDILPKLGPRPVDQIQPMEIMALIDGIENCGAESADEPENTISGSQGTDRPDLQDFTVESDNTLHHKPSIAATAGATCADVVTLCPIIDWSQVPTEQHTGLDQQGLRFEGILPCPVPCSQRTYVLRVKGASMEPKFGNGDLIFVDPDMTAESGKYVVVRLAGSEEADFQQLIVEGGRQYLNALNPDWPDRIVELDPGAVVCGVVAFKGEMV